MDNGRSRFIVTPSCEQNGTGEDCRRVGLSRLILNEDALNEDSLATRAWSDQHRTGGRIIVARLSVKAIFIICRQRWFAVNLILLLACTLVANESPAAEGSPESAIKILTFNIMWEENGVRAGNLSLPVWADRKDSVARLITSAEADIVGFQEASPEQQAGLRAGLPAYTLVHHEATNNTNPILFKTARFQLLDSGAFVLNAKPEIEGTNIGVRSSMWAHLEDRKSRQRLWVYSLHLDHRSKGPTRQISAVRLAERMTRHGGAAFVTGDFNTSEFSPTMAFFYGRTALKNDAGERVMNPRPLVTAYKFIHPEDSKRVIDHVLAGPGIRIRNADRTASGKASDHNIFWAEALFE